MDKLITTIAVDLTPILPGGENGGAKIFVLELLSRLAEIAPETHFLLLTQTASHEELAIMDRPNMQRLLVVGAAESNSTRPRLKRIATRLLPHLPGRVRRLVGRVGYKVLGMLKRRGQGGGLLRGLHADLLFCPFTAPTYFEPGIPTVCTIYDLQYKTYPEFFSVEDVINRDRTFIEACRRATMLTAISDYSRGASILHGHLDPAHIQTIYLRMAQRITLGVENEHQVLHRYDLKPKRYLIYPANFWKHKNHEMLLTAFGMACHEGLAEDIKLVCTGAPGERQTWLLRVVKTMGLGDRVVFPGYLPLEELTALMANSVGVIFPSLYEGFGLPVIEAMAAGIPVACSNCTSLPEVAEDAAILFDSRIPTQIMQAMMALVADEPLRNQLIQSGLQRAAEFADADKMAREYWALFQKSVATEKNQDLLSGVYPDGWAGSRINIQVASSKTPQTIEIDFFAPDWLPFSTLSVIAFCGGKQQGELLTIRAGAGASLSLPIEATGGGYEINISPSCTPASLGYGDDKREISLTVKQCSILRSAGESVILFPEKLQA